MYIGSKYGSLSPLITNNWNQYQLLEESYRSITNKNSENKGPLDVPGPQLVNLSTTAILNL